MDFLKCSIVGVSYGVVSSKVEIAAVKQIALDKGTGSTPTHSSGTHDAWENRVRNFSSSEIELEAVVTCKTEDVKKTQIKVFSFEDNRIMNGNWLNEPNVDVILLFFRILALCQSAILEPNEETVWFNYEAESPDEGAFLVAAREFGFEFCKRTQTSVFARERYTSKHPIDREFKILNLLEFSSKRKQMSVIVEAEDARILLLCKGADRLAKNGRMFEEDTNRHLNEYGDAGLRTLALAYKKLEESE